MAFPWELIMLDILWAPHKLVIISRIESFRNSGTQFARNAAKEEEEIMNIKFTLLIFTMVHWVECGGFLTAKQVSAEEAVLLDKPGAAHSFPCGQQQHRVQQNPV